MSDIEDQGDVENFGEPTPRLDDHVKKLIAAFVSDKLIDLLTVSTRMLLKWAR
jgi:hypothetical protein